MDDDQRPDSSASEDAETPSPRRGLGRFAARFRRERDQPEVDASPPPEDEADADPEDAADETTGNDAPWLVPATLDHARAAVGPEPLAPELDLTRTPMEALEPEVVPEAPLEASQPEAEPASAGSPSIQQEREDKLPEMSAQAQTEAAEPAATSEQPHVSTAEADVPAAEPDVPTAKPDIAILPGTPAPLPVPVLVSPQPEIDQDGESEVEQLAGPRTHPAGISAHLAVLTAIATSIIMAFLLIEPSPRWLLLLGAAAVVFGLDGTLRQTWRAPFSLGQETAPFLFVPALYMMAVPVLIEHNVSGELVFFVGLGAGFGFGALTWAEVASVRPQAPEYDQARVIVTANTYLTGFAIFSLSYVFDVGLLAAIVATSVAAAMLAVEVLREGEIDPMETLGLSLVAGLVIGEARWLLYYIPLDTYLAGLTLLLVFYLATGLLHSHVIRALNRVVAVEYSGIAAAGLALVILARAVGLA